MLSDDRVQEVAQTLYRCLRERCTIAPVSETDPAIDVDDAYRISRAFLALREAAGEQVIGKKIGVTSAAVQEMLGVYQPDFGFLTDAMLVRDGVVDTTQLIAPRAEAEIAFRLARPLRGPGVTAAAVLDATQSVMACFEIVDSRISDWRIGICDTIADNASCGVFVLAETEMPVRGLNLAEARVTVHKNGEFLSEGVGSAVQGAPENAVAWLANTLGEYGIPFEAGEIILSGSMVPLADAAAGDVFSMSISGLGSAEVRFV
jgi:2-oxopent-4-enoate/cis-2-oxohex-4-enoate hydratase